MLVFVNKKNVEPYCTVLLAVKYAGWRTKVVFYDPFKCLIKMEKMWQSSNNYSKRAFYILKESNEWIKYKKDKQQYLLVYPFLVYTMAKLPRIFRFTASSLIPLMAFLTPAS